MLPAIRSRGDIALGREMEMVALVKVPAVKSDQYSVLLKLPTVEATVGVVKFAVPPLSELKASTCADVPEVALVLRLKGK